MVKRNFWINQLENGWKEKTILWLAGVRRCGKTTLSQSIPNTEYFDCELPRTRRQLEDPEEFLTLMKGKRVILDEIHRLGNPSELLKIAADHFPSVKILATGSSSLGASSKFKDTLTGRKREIWLTPIMSDDMEDFKNPDLKHRFLFGGLPPFFLASGLPEKDFQEWMDAFWTKDIQELFRLEKKYSFQKFTELILAQSGGIFEATRFTQSCEVSRMTILNYLKILEATYLVHIIRPFSTHKPTEIISAPKVFGFDTGFVCLNKGWHELRHDDLGFLWEHFVLNEMQAHLQTRRIHYWRDKQGHEVDFVIAKTSRQAAPWAIECKWKAAQFEEKGLRAFLKLYPQAKAFCVANDAEKRFHQKINKARVEFLNLPAFISLIKT